MVEATLRPLALWCGDFFGLTADDVTDCVAVYDRAALIALPPPMRENPPRTGLVSASWAQGRAR